MNFRYLEWYEPLKVHGVPADTEGKPVSRVKMLWERIYYGAPHKVDQVAWDASYEESKQLLLEWYDEAHVDAIQHNEKPENPLPPGPRLPPFQPMAGGTVNVFTDEPDDQDMVPTGS